MIIIKRMKIIISPLLSVSLISICPNNGKWRQPLISRKLKVARLRDEVHSATLHRDQLRSHVGLLRTRHAQALRSLHERLLWPQPVQRYVCLCVCWYVCVLVCFVYMFVCTYVLMYLCACGLIAHAACTNTAVITWAAVMAATNTEVYTCAWYAHVCLIPYADVLVCVYIMLHAPALRALHEPMQRYTRVFACVSVCLCLCLCACACTCAFGGQ